MNALSFNQVSLNPVTHADNQIWITSAELAKALGYKAVDSVTKIFNRNSDEFTEEMSQTVNLTVSGKINGLQHKSVRIFSLRGCYAIAFFAKTEVAKQFRKWVLDLIETEAQKFTGRSTTTDERTGLRDAVNAVVSKKSMLYPDAYKLVHQRFNVQHIDELTLEQVGEATEYLHRLLLNDNGERPVNLEPLIMCALTCDSAWETVKPILYKVNPDMTSSMNGFFASLRVTARTTARSIGFTASEVHQPWLKYGMKNYIVTIPMTQTGEYLVRLNRGVPELAQVAFKPA
ncbi:hypothetical protein ADP71_17110 [Vitreoscilla sp. C1]|uniref:BRO-N domain-containing protein n=1 Tax=Vitreoscilla sp. (strain C1) TaxID=96942 RepID=UPI00148EDEC6|nr:BRO family protein [Vitreoscilla sp. C1]AUZ05238.2 hypothetical protein ADP71_17110 [Vitreoscilla sp. C1]